MPKIIVANVDSRSQQSNAKKSPQVDSGPKQDPWKATKTKIDVHSLTNSKQSPQQIVKVESKSYPQTVEHTEKPYNSLEIKQHPCKIEVELGSRQTRKAKANAIKKLKKSAEANSDPISLQKQMKSTLHSQYNDDFGDKSDLCPQYSYDFGTHPDNKDEDTSDSEDFDECNEIDFFDDDDSDVDEACEDEFSEVVVNEAFGKFNICYNSEINVSDNSNINTSADNFTLDEKYYTFGPIDKSMFGQGL